MRDPEWDWDPRDESVLRDQVAACDELRERCPVAHSRFLGWSVLRHADALTVLGDHETFSSQVSKHVAVPNGMDPPEHTAYRAVVDRCFTPELVGSFETKLRAIAAAVVADALDGAEDVDGAGEVEVMSAIAEPFAARAQCAYLGWPTEVAAALQEWSADSARATLARDRAELSRVAERFDRIIVGVLDRQRAADPAGGAGGATLTGRLLAERVDGAPLTDSMLVSMLRNWTAGELGTIAAAVGIIAEFLARQPDVQRLLRTDPGLRGAATDEILRLEAPLIANRRRTTRQVSIGGRTIPADEPVTILWPAVQRDPTAHADATGFRLDRDPAGNLLYGRGPHACPGEGLARLELGLLLDELFRALPGFALAPDRAPIRAVYPSGGFTEVRIVPTVASSGDRSDGSARTDPLRSVAPPLD